MLRILLERIYLNFRYGYLGHIFYFSLKLDRKGDKLTDHITEGEFIKTRDFVNQNYPSSSFSYAGITRDKILSKILLNSLGGKVAHGLGSIHLSGSPELPTIMLLDEYGNSASWENLVGKNVFFKPINSECGHGVMKFKIISGEEVQFDEGFISLADLLHKMEDAVIHYGPAMLEDCIVQHPRMAALHQTSVNTLRISTVQSENGAQLFSSVCRIGAHSAPNDNYSSGGIIVGIDGSGKLLSVGFMRPEYGDAELDAHPDSNIEFKGYQIPFYHEAVKLCMDMHNHLKGIYSLGWDVAITPEGPMIVECNDNWEIQLYEITHERGFRKEYNETFVRTAKILKRNAIP